MTHPLPFLTQQEIDEICAPLQVGAAKRKLLERMGMVVKTKGNGQPLVARAEFDRVMTGGQKEAAAAAGMAPNAAGLAALFGQRKHGASA